MMNTVGVIMASSTSRAEYAFGRLILNHHVLIVIQCYAKCIDLSEQKEPDIFHAIRFGSILENVVFSAETRDVNYADSTLTENTRW